MSTLPSFTRRNPTAVPPPSTRRDKVESRCGSERRTNFVLSSNATRRAAISQPTAFVSRASISSVCVTILPSPRGLFQILSDHDAPTGLTPILHFLSVCASGSRRGVLGSKAAVSLQHGVVWTADFVAPCHRFRFQPDGELSCVNPVRTVHDSTRDPLDRAPQRLKSAGRRRDPRERT